MYAVNTEVLLVTLPANQSVYSLFTWKVFHTPDHCCLYLFQLFYTGFFWFVFLKQGHT